MARILIIDDDKVVRLSLQRLLERMGHTVREAADGASGLEICTSETIDLVITDIFMPGLNGLETIAMLRRWGLSMPVLAFTGGVPGHNLDVLKLAMEQGANKTLLKPYGLGEMQTAVTELLARSCLMPVAPYLDVQIPLDETKLNCKGEA